MTQVMWRNGGPLRTPGQAIGGSQKCCCENPPPGECWCPGNCSYAIEVVSPSQVAIKSPRFLCPDFYTYPPDATDSAELWLFDGLTYADGWASCFGAPSVEAYVSASGGRVQFDASFCNPDRAFDFVRVHGEASISIGCFDEDSVPWIDVKWKVYAWRYIIENAGFYYTPHSVAIAESGKRVYPSTFCQYTIDRTCYQPNSIAVPPNGFRFLSTPITLAITRQSVAVNGTPHLYSYETFESRGYIPYDETQTADFVSAIADALSITFRITSRKSCRSTGPCCCLDGVITEVESSEECGDGIGLDKPATQEQCAATGVGVGYYGRQVVADFVAVGGGYVAFGYEDFYPDGDEFFSCTIDGESYPFNRLNIQFLVYTINACNKCYYSVNVLAQWFSEQAGVDSKVIATQTGNPADDEEVYFYSEECETLPLWRFWVENAAVDELPPCVPDTTVPIVEMIYAP